MVMQIELTEKTIERIADIIERRIEKRVLSAEQLYNRNEICKILNISTRTFDRYNVPYSVQKEKGRKLYSLPFVKDYLKK